MVIPVLLLVGFVAYICFSIAVRKAFESAGCLGKLLLAPFAFMFGLDSVFHIPGISVVFLVLAISMIPFYGRFITKASYSDEAIPVVGSIRTWVGLYQYEHERLPFDDAEAGTVTTWRKTDDGQYEPIQFALGGSETNVLSATDNVFSRLDMSPSEFSGKKLTPDQVYMACLGGVSDTGVTNAYAYAIGVFGSGKTGLKRGTGYAILEAYFRDVDGVESEKWKVESENWEYDDAGKETGGYRLVATWENYDRIGATKGEQIRFGLDPEPGVCMLISPEAFTPGAVTKLRGDGPDSVEYWVERLRDAPCGRWEYSLP